MPEQPPDPLHYEMKIPPEPDPNKKRAPEKTASDNDEDASQTTRDLNDAGDGDRSKADAGEK